MSFKVGTVLVLCALLVAIAEGYITGRILGGAIAKPGQFPYEVSLSKRGSHICGGSIISENFILTAAHCVLTIDGRVVKAKHLSIRAGSINRFFGGVVVNVKSITVNENYDEDTNVADVAVVELEKPLNFSSKIQPIELTTEAIPSDSDVIISGWGMTENIVFPAILKYTTVKSSSSSKCSEADGVVSEQMLCLDHEEDKGACLRDTGSPATYNGKLVGVSGIVLEYCGTNKPDAYAKVSFYVDWINSIIA